MCIIEWYDLLCSYKTADQLEINNITVKTCDMLLEGYNSVFNGTNETIKNSKYKKKVDDYINKLNNYKIPEINLEKIWEVYSENLKRDDNNLLENFITPKETEKAIKTLKLSSPGISKFSNNHLKINNECMKYCSLVLSIFMNLGYTPDKLRMSIIKPLIKNQILL